MGFYNEKLGLFWVDLYRQVRERERERERGEKESDKFGLFGASGHGRG